MALPNSPCFSAVAEAWAAQNTDPLTERNITKTKTKKGGSQEQASAGLLRHADTDLGWGLRDDSISKPGAHNPAGEINQAQK